MPTTKILLSKSRIQWKRQEEIERAGGERGEHTSRDEFVT